MAHFPKVSASIDYILLCILVFDRAAPLSLCPTVHCPTLYCTLSQWPGSSQLGISFKNKVSGSQSNVFTNSRKEKITTLILTIIFPPASNLTVWGQMLAS